MKKIALALASVFAVAQFAFANEPAAGTTTPAAEPAVKAEATAPAATDKKDMGKKHAKKKKKNEEHK